MGKYSEFEYKKVLAIIRSLENFLDHDEALIPDDSSERYLITVSTYDGDAIGGPGVINFHPMETSTVRMPTIRWSSFYFKKFLPLLSAKFFTEGGELIYEFQMNQSTCKCLRRQSEASLAEVLKIDANAGITIESSLWEDVIDCFIERIGYVVNNNLSFGKLEA